MGILFPKEFCMLMKFFLSQCNHSIAFDTFYKEINFPPTKLGWIGSGCSVATEPTAELTQYYNITQVCCIEEGLIKSALGWTEVLVD